MEQEIYDKAGADVLPWAQESIRQLETVADLFGARPMDIHRCRVLELGAGAGKAMVFQAEEFPGSVFLGVDSSRSRIDEGRQMVSDLALANIELRQCHLMEINRSWGAFDYIIVHDLFSRVPPQIQDKIFEICKNNLSQQGVAVISFNTYPGWHFKDYLRNLMLLHTMQANSFDSAGMEIQQARAIVNYLADAKRGQTDYLGSFLQNAREIIQGQSGRELYHEYLEVDNHPCYFLDFYRRLKQWGLDYLTDFQWTERNIWMEEKEIRQLMEKTEPLEVSEQYLDFLVNRTSRYAMICHEDVLKSRTFRHDFVERYHLFLTREVEMVKGEDGFWCFNRPGTISLRIPADRLGDAVVGYLKQIGSKYFTLRKCWGAILNEAGKDPSFNVNELQRLLDGMIRFGVLKISLHPVHEVAVDPHYPYVRGFVRMLARKNSGTLPNSNFEPHAIGPLPSFIVQQLDGRHSVQDVATTIQKGIREGLLSIRIHEEDVLPENRDQIVALVHSSIEDLHRLQLVVN